ncbi:hypothetical protein BKI52_44135 [marine bacterium AO1-C]|nr:hypothetical protein BKI52_44135 [marine bacterium AO1-C]
MCPYSLQPYPARLVPHSNGFTNQLNPQEEKNINLYSSKSAHYKKSCKKSPEKTPLWHTSLVYATKYKLVDVCKDLY